MSIARHHNEWISLTEVSGPFLSLTVLLKAFPQGLPTSAEGTRVPLRLTFEEWEANRQSKTPDFAIHRAWVRHILLNGLELLPEYLREGHEIPTKFNVVVESVGEKLRPDWVLLDTENEESARLLVQIYDAGQNLEKPVSGRQWKASPAARMADLLRGTDVKLGLVTNGEQWMLIHAPRGETTTYASWFASLWLEEPLTWRSFTALLNTERFFGVPESETLEGLFAASLADQQEVTDELGRQVRQALEVLVARFDEADAENGRTLLAGIAPREVYEGALAVMMRLVFLFCAEENKLLLQSDSEIYEANYSVSSLRAELHEIADQSGEELLSHYYDAWDRLLATFRLLYGGTAHDELRFPAYGGALFDPDRWTWLEGREAGTDWKSTPASPLPIDNRTVLHLLEALQVLQVKVPGGGRESRVLSFRALDIEQIGHVYEGLLDHTAKRAQDPYLSLEGAGGLEPEIALSVLEAEYSDPKKFIKFLGEETGRSVKAIERALAEQFESVGALRSACSGDETLFERVLPFANLIRRDSFGRLVVIAEGALFVTQSSDRRSSGTHYTTRALTEPLVQKTLDPQLYRGFTEGVHASPETLISPREILALKICDPACGSASVLVQACRYLSEKLVEAWEQKAQDAEPASLAVAPYGEPAIGLPDEMPLPEDTEERLVLARRLIAERCLYGVDSDPLAVEMARLSLWLVTMQKCRPFTFLDHAIRLGDSLLGVDWEQLRTQSLDRKNAGAAAQVEFSKAIGTAIEARNHIADLSYDVPSQARELERAENALRNAQLLADAVIAPALLSKEELKSRRKTRAEVVKGFHTRAAAVAQNAEEWREPLREELDEIFAGRRPFHWPLQFPEVFWREGEDKSTPGGFDAIIGNPPFVGGQRITGTMGVPYREYLIESLARGVKGSADLVAYFYLRAFDLLKSGGSFGLIATNTIAQGDTREVGLDQITARGGAIYHANPSQKWPGKAALEVAIVHARKGSWQSTFTLGEALVAGITPFLAAPGAVVGNPQRLAANAGKSFIGSYVLGMGFVLTPEAARALIEKDARNADVLFPYLNGEDLNSRPDQSPSRWVINFKDWPLDRDSAPPEYSGPVAADYPDCLEIVERLVKPERAKNNREAYREFWWRYGERRPGLYEVIADLPRMLVTAAVSPTTAFAFAERNIVIAHKLVAFAIPSSSDFALLQSTFHREWAYKFSSTLGGVTLNYSPSDCFETFPFPLPDASQSQVLGELGAEYSGLRASICEGRELGLTKVYNLFHDAETCGDAVPVRNAAPPFDDIRQLRDLHRRMDEAVAAAYGWSDVALGHDFHATAQGTRYTLSEAARGEVLDRLLQLNHDRYAEEVKAGLHDKGAKAKAKNGSRKVRHQKIIESLGLPGI